MKMKATIKEEIELILDDYISCFRIKENGKLAVSKSEHEKIVERIKKLVNEKV